MVQTKELSPTQVLEAASAIKAGGLVVFPTETVYGLGANALDPQAAAAIFRAKGRPQDNPLIVHIGNAAAIEQVASEVSDLARVIIGEFCPGPITVIVPRHPALAEAVSAGLPTVGLRIPGLPVAQAFLDACGMPVAAPSANQSGRPSPTDFDMAWAEMAGRADAVIRGPACSVGLESTIVWPEGDSRLHLLRPGAVNPAMIREALDRHGFNGVKIIAKMGDHDIRPIDLPKAPGTRYRHYSPAAALSLFRSRSELNGLLAANPLGSGLCLILPENWGTLPQSGADEFRFADVEEYSRQLYRWLVEADNRNKRQILAYLPEESPQTLALRDRLSRAAGFVN